MKIGILGDLIQSPKSIYDSNLLEILNSTDFNIANLEAPFIKKDFIPANKKRGLHQLTNNCNNLHKLNIKAVSLANNHIFDFGLAGLENTIRILESENIDYFGAGSNLTEASKVKEFRIRNKSIALGGYISPYLTPYIAKKNKPGVAPLKENIIIKALNSSHTDYKLIYNHWPQEFESYPEPLYLDLSKNLINYCDTIIGSHSHCIQGITKLNNKSIFYSLGNFTIPHANYYNIFLKKYPEHCYTSFFIILYFKNNGHINYQIIPYKINEDGTQILKMTNDDKKLFQNKLNKISLPLQLNYKKYRSFYNSKKYRKFRPTLHKCHFLNLIHLKINSLIIRFIHKFSYLSAKFLDFLGLRKVIRKKFSFILDKLFKL